MERAWALAIIGLGLSQCSGAYELCCLGQGWALVSWIWNKERIWASTFCPLAWYVLAPDIEGSFPPLPHALTQMWPSHWSLPHLSTCIPGNTPYIPYTHTHTPIHFSALVLPEPWPSSSIHVFYLLIQCILFLPLECKLYGTDLGMLVWFSLSTT